MKKQSKTQQNIVSKLLHLVEVTTNHKLFKPITISIITSFILFNGFSYLTNYFNDKTLSSVSNLEHPIKINIPDNYGSNLNEKYVLQHDIKDGDTLLSILLGLGVSEPDMFNIVSEMKKVYDPRLLKVNDKFIIKYHAQYQSGSNNPKKAIVDSIHFSPSAEIEIDIIGNKNIDGNHSYSTTKTTKVLTKQILKYAVTIRNGLYVDGTDVGISPNIMINMINLYSFDVDFQRDIRDGDRFEILFESFYDNKGNRVKDGDVLFSSLNLQQKRTIDMYLNKDGNRNEYFDSKGNSVRKSLLRTPINGARISSGFGVRRHPVLGYSKMHKGVDFAAPTGTPIFAAGSGTITYYGRNGGYGNFVRIRHNKDYSTGYAHASRFAKRLRVGSTVKQGDVIAYVGTTGRSTGPHLHYEIIFKGKQINPNKVKSLSGVKLTGKKLKEFLIGKNQINKYLKNIPNQNKL